MNCLNNFDAENTAAFQWIALRSEICPFDLVISSRKRLPFSFPPFFLWSVTSVYWAETDAARDHKTGRRIREPQADLLILEGRV